MTMQDPAAEYLRIAEHYRKMSDEELLELAPQSENLTPEAQQALSGEMRHRGLKVETTQRETSAEPSFAGPRFRQSSAEAASADYSPEPDPYEEERRLVELCTVWSLRDALKVQRILDVAGIPFFMGPEKATDAEKVTSNFASGVSVQIMAVGWPWAAAAMWRDYFPEDDRTYREPEDGTVPPIRCPRCNSTEVVFNRLVAAVGAPSDAAARKFEWTCDACGATWQDDGVVKEGPRGDCDSETLKP